MIINLDNIFRNSNSYQVMFVYGDIYSFLDTSSQELDHVIVKDTNHRRTYKTVT
jgi:hypothetical protein